MNINISPNNIIVSNFNYYLEITNDHFILKDPRTDHRLIEADSPLVLYPEFHEQACNWEVKSLRGETIDKGAVHIQITGTSETNGILRIEVTCWYDHIELGAEADITSDSRIAHWHMFGNNSRLNFFHIHHWRSRHGHNSTYETYNLYQGGKTTDEVSSPSFPEEMREQFTRVYNLTTYSSDWHFNPRPSFMLFQRDSVMLGIGARELPYGFGLEAQVSAQTLHHLRYNYGAEYGMEVTAGTSSQAPRTYLWIDHNQGIWDSVDHYVNLLQEDKEVPRRSLRDVPHWWLRPAYCTWNDQGYLSGNAAFYNFPADGFKGKHPVEAFDAAMLDHLLDTIEQKQLPFGSVIIDDGWQKNRGDWIPHPEKFPDLRSQIDRIHNMGMKVILWIAPFDFYADAEIRKKNEWMCGNGILGRHEMPMIDYSNPKVQNEYVEPLAKTLFSSDPDCLDADGLKLDFLADKLHPLFPVHDIEWRGEERFNHGYQSLMYRLLKQWKPDGQVLGGTAHPHFIDCQDLVRTYDVPVSQFQHSDRAEMIRHFNPGNFVTLDMTETKSLADVEQHLDIAYRYNLLYECGRIAPDPETNEFRFGPDYYPLLRRKLLGWGRK